MSTRPSCVREIGSNFCRPLNSRSKCFRALEAVAPDDLHRAQRADDIARQPHFAVAAGRDGAKQFVIGNGEGRREAF